jgi:beta-N-acetylhexosaminidase
VFISYCIAIILLKMQQPFVLSSPEFTGMLKILLLLSGLLLFSPQPNELPQTGKGQQKAIAVLQQQIVADSLDFKIGQLIIFGFYGTAINKNDAVYKGVAEGKVGSILIYGRNLAAKKSADSLIKLINGFQNVAPFPLFISIDQEGGIVNRLKPELGFPKMPSAQWLGNKDNEDTTKFYADNIGYTLSRLGINLNYAPVLDVYNPNCPVMGARERCFAKDPAIITKHAGITINSHHYFGVKTVVKHFPGHGNSLADSHFGIADVTKTWVQDELTPYRNLIQSGQVDAVMTAHIVNGKLDPSKLPATLSKKIMTGILRDSLGFKGVIFSDDMMMQAISAQYSIEDALFKALDAGVDVLMFSNNIKGVKDYSPNSIHATIKKLVVTGRISAEQIEASYKRVMALKMRQF